jgi:hypothetical protein
MAKVVRKSRAPVEGAYGIKFTEIIVILMVLAAGGLGVRYYMQYLKSPSAALQKYFSAVKGGNVQGQYDLLDDDDKTKYMADKAAYVERFKQAHGYTERVTNVTIEAAPVDPAATEVSLNATVDILANSQGKELYQAGTTKGFTDKYVMRKDKEGAWKLVLSKSGDGHGKLNLANAEPTPDSQF